MVTRELVIHRDSDGNERLWSGILFNGYRRTDTEKPWSEKVTVDGVNVGDRPIVCAARDVFGVGFVVRLKASFGEFDSVKDCLDPMFALGFADVEYLHGRVEVVLTETAPQEPPEEPPQ